MLRGKLNDGVKHDSTSGFNLKGKGTIDPQNLSPLKNSWKLSIFGDKEWKRRAPQF